MHRLIALLALAVAAPVWAQQKDCSKVPEPYRATCEGAMQKKAAVDKDCAGLQGDALKNCVAQKNPGGSTAATSGGNPAAAAAREKCRAQFDVNDKSKFEACMRAEMSKGPR